MGSQESCIVPLVGGRKPLDAMRWDELWGGALRIIACLEDQAVIERILSHLAQKGPAAPAARLPPARAPAQAEHLSSLRKEPPAKPGAPD